MPTPDTTVFRQVAEERQQISNQVQDVLMNAGFGHGEQMQFLLELLFSLGVQNPCCRGALVQQMSSATLTLAKLPPTVTGATDAIPTSSLQH